MRLTKLTALAAAVIIPMTLISCNYGYQSSRDKKEKEAHDTLREEARKGGLSELTSRYEPIDIDELNKKIEKLIDDCHSSGNDVQGDIDELMKMLDKSMNAKSLSEIAYYMDFKSDALEAEADGCTEEASVAYEAVSYALHAAYASAYPEYVDLLKPFIDDEWLDYYTSPGVDLARIEKYARQSFESSDSDLDSYYDVAYSDDKDEEKLDLEAAKIYLEILEGFDTETFYDSFNRDYTPEEIIPVCETVRQELVPVYNHFYDNIMENEKLSDLYYEEFPEEKLLPTLSEFAQKLSPEIGASAQKLIDKDLCFFGSGKNSYNGGFTAFLPVERDSAIYLYRYGSLDDMVGLIHEFGHFYASYYDDTNTYDSINNLDIAEIQSQGMELLFMKYYDEIFGDQAEIMRLYKLSDILDYAISGCLVGEFEYRVLENRDSYSPQDVVDCYYEIMGDYYPDSHLYEISHIFEEPGYYISYGVSALAALDIINDCYDDPQRALEQYEKIARAKAFSPEASFKDSLAQCGFSDVLSEDYIRGLSDIMTTILEREVQGL